MNDIQKELVKIALEALDGKSPDEIKAFMKAVKIPNDVIYKYFPEASSNDNAAAKRILADAITRSGYFS